MGYIVKLGFTRVYIIFLTVLENIRLWVLVRTASLRRFLRLPKTFFLSRNTKIIRVFLYTNFQFFDVNYSIYLNRRVFVLQETKVI